MQCLRVYIKSILSHVGFTCTSKFIYDTVKSAIRKFRQKNTNWLKFTNNGTRNFVTQATNNNKCVQRQRQVSYSALFTFLVGWHASIVSLPPGDVILAQLACPLNDGTFSLHMEQQTYPSTNIVNYVTEMPYHDNQYGLSIKHRFL